MPIRAENLASGRADCTFTYQGEECHVVFRADRITKQFRAKTLQLQRDSIRLAHRQELLMSKIQTVVALDGTIEAQAEDEEAARAIKQLIADDEILKRGMDGLVIEVVSEWDVLKDDGAMLALTPDNLYPIPAVFLSAALEAIANASGLGEVIGRNSSTTSLSSLKPKDEPEIGRPYLNSIPTLSQANGSNP